MSKRLFEYVIVNAILFLTDAQIVFAASISDITDGTNRYVGAFGFPIKIYDGNTDIGTYYAVFQDLMDNTEINGVTAILNNASLAGSDNLSWTETTHKYAEVSQSMTDEQIFDSVNNIAGILEKTIQDGKPFDDLPDGVKEALKAKYDVNQSIEEYLKNNWSVSSVESGVKVALRSAYESFNSDMQTPLDKSVKIKDSNLTLNDTAAIVNRSKYSPAVDGDIAISNSKIIVNGTNDLIAHTEIIFDGSSCLQINGGAELTVQSAGNMIALKNSDLILNGSIVGNVSMEGTVSLQGSGSVSGSLNVA